MPVLLVEGIAEAIARSRARVVLVMNLMSEPGETDGYGPADFVRAIVRHAPRIAIHDVLVNVTPIPDDLIRRFAAAEARPIAADREALIALGCRPVERDLLGAPTPHPPRREQARPCCRGSGAGGHGAMNAMMNAMAMSPRGWWRRHPVTATEAAQVPDSQLAFGGLIAFTFILLLAPQMMVPALARPVLHPAGAVRRLGGGVVVPLQSHAHRAAAHGRTPASCGSGSHSSRGPASRSPCRTGRGEASPSSPACS